jgi:hypothetical protein
MLGHRIKNNYKEHFFSWLEEFTWVVFGFFYFL